MFPLIDASKYDTLLLDRDGVINVHRPGNYVKKWSEFQFVDGFLSFISEYSKSFKHIFVVTNQRCVGKGIITDETLCEIHEKMVDEIKKVGGRIDKIYCCTAILDSDERRKPNIGMFKEIMKDFPDVVPQKCIMLGDMKSDMLFAERCGIKGILV